MGWEATIRGMRNPKNSWARSDSFRPGEWCEDEYCVNCQSRDPITGKCQNIGPNDLDLMRRLAAGGSVHAKYRRYIVVYVDITAPIYWWTEFDTYRTGVTPNPMDIEMNSTSTMHKIAAKEFELSDFSTDHLMGCTLGVEHEGGSIPVCNPMQTIETVIYNLNVCRELYRKTKDKKYWWQMIQLLPNSYHYKRTVMMNYEVLSHIYPDRSPHKLDEWRKFCEWIKTLPHSEIITGEE